VDSIISEYIIRLLRITRRDKDLLEKICRARGEDPSDFIRRAMRKEFAILSYLPEEEKKL